MILTLLYSLLIASFASGARAMDEPDLVAPAILTMPDVLMIKGQHTLGQTKKRKRTDLSPAKGEIRIVGIQSPLAKRIKPLALFNQLRAEIITSERKDFSEGCLAYASVLTPSTSLAVNADDEGWQKWAENFIAESGLLDDLIKDFAVEEFENLLVDLAHFLHDKIEKIDNELGLRDISGTELECRHYATYSAVLFSKLAKYIASASVLWTTSIQVLRATKLDDQWKGLEGHAWNLVTVRHEKNTYQWHFDAFRFALVRIENEKTDDETILVKFEDSQDYDESKLINNASHSGWVSYTMDKCININKKDSLYNAKNEILLDAICDNFLAVQYDILSTKTVFIQKNRVSESKARRKLFD